MSNIDFKLLIHTTATHSWCEFPLCGGTVYAKNDQELLELIEYMGFTYEKATN